ncbi:ribonuclease P protein component [Candidatus Curtissbacteria bacterium]|nr:ribonuclease P protein component [Candidatus Curtissbacteria bacterium]
MTDTRANFVVKFQKTPTSRPVIIVSTRVAKRSVDRNRIRRVTKEALRKMGQIDREIVVIVKNNIAGFKMQEVQKELERIIAK